MAEKKTPIEQVTDLLAEMTARATEAEQRTNAAEKSSTEWYTRYLEKSKELEAANKRIAELEDDLKRVVEYIEKHNEKPTKKGAKA